MSNTSLSVRVSASSSDCSRSFPSSSISSYSALKYCPPLSSSSMMRALATASTITLSILFGSFVTCLMLATVHTLYRPSRSGSSSSGSICGTSSTFCDAFSACSIAFFDISLFRSKCMIIFGTTVSPRSATKGNAAVICSICKILSLRLCA